MLFAALALLCDTVWIKKDHKINQIVPIKTFTWPLPRLGWASKIPLLIWHDLIWRISVLLFLADMWTNMWGVRLREVSPGLLWELMWDNSRPCLREKRGRGRGRVRYDEQKEVSGMSDRRGAKLGLRVKIQKSEVMEEMWTWTCGGLFIHTFSRATCLSLSLSQSVSFSPKHLTIVVLEVLAFWQLCLEHCDRSLEGRVCMSGCVLSDSL